MGGVVGAITGSIAGNKANGAAQYAASQAEQLASNLFTENKDRNAPFLNAGTGAVNELAYLEGVGGSAQDGATGAQGSLNTPFTYQDLYKDPSYDFRLNQGLNSLQASAAARGTLNSGAGLKAVNNYAQDYASQEYQNAFNRYQTQNQNVYSRLAGLAGIGQNAASADQNAGKDYEGVSTQNLWNSANSSARNAGTQAGAWASGLGSLANFASGL